MPDIATFQTRARTVDHLGRGQIADCPTAVSELWKNGFDAYAENVDLHIFDGAPRVAAITDDGFGMTKVDFLNRWLVLGTESKVTAEPLPGEDRFGLPVRPRQGEKGIGRLSAAFLAPVNVIISKKRGHPFMVALVDWRLFENPFLFLEDLRLPVQEVASPADLLPTIASMLPVIRENLTGADGPKERSTRMLLAWDAFSARQREEGRGPVAEVIGSGELIAERHLNEWLVFHGVQDHGTALYMPHVHDELGVWVDHGDTGDDDDTVEVKTKLKTTLNGFTDPYSKNPLQFAYEVWVHKAGRKNRVISSSDSFSRQDLLLLEHVVEGTFDETGFFRGSVKAFGKDRGLLEWRPTRPLRRTGGDRVGPLAFSIGTFEQEVQRSTHSPAEHAGLLAKAVRYSGLAVYRDGLRVMPYGRPDSDFFGMEERRSKHAGREFWSHRRNFGRVALTREGNPNLRDKAGREGLIDNKARREMRLLVIDFLQYTARRYFGTASEIREGEVEDQRAAHNAAREAAEKALARRRRAFRQALKQMAPRLHEAVETASRLGTALSEAKRTNNFGALLQLTVSVEGVRAERRSYELPPTPPDLGTNEENYRSYRDQLSAYDDLVQRLQDELNEAAESLAKGNPEELLRRAVTSRSQALRDKLDRYESSLREAARSLVDDWSRRIEEDRARFDTASEGLIEDLQRGESLPQQLKLLDFEAEQLERRFVPQYEALLRTVHSLAEGIDLDSALTVTEDERLALENRVQKVEALAQLGIAVEIIGHELETLDDQVRRNLLQLSPEVRATAAYRTAFESHRALADQLRFLAPLKLAGYRARQTITGAQIVEFVEHFFARRFERSGVRLTVTPAFRDFRIVDLESRVFPVFINLVNNSLYWLKFVDDRRIQFDRRGDKVVVGDSGRGVDPDDVPHLFELFFTRRAEGRGVGLYLCRANLAVAYHTIHYAVTEDEKVLGGANFIIEFKGIEYAE